MRGMILLCGALSVALGGQACNEANRSSGDDVSSAVGKTVPDAELSTPSPDAYPIQFKITRAKAGAVGSTSSSNGNGPQRVSVRGKRILNRFVVIGACSKERIEGELAGSLGAMESCLEASQTPLEGVLMKVVLEANGTLAPTVTGVGDGRTVDCLEKVMSRLDIKKTGPGTCLARWGLR